MVSKPLDAPTITTGVRVDFALDASRAGTWHWDMASGRVVWDERLEAMHGLAPGGFGQSFEHWVELLHPDEVDGILADVQGALAEPGAYDLLHRAIWPDGSIHWIECRGRVTVDDHGRPTGTIGVAFDVTERERVSEELRAARAVATSLAARLQESLLGPPILLEAAGHAVRYVPATDQLAVGGDWYNAAARPDGRVAIAVGDVVGNGLEAATVMGQLRSALAAASLQAPSAAEALETLDTFATTVPGAHCATAVLAIADLRHQTLEYARAGHLPPVVVAPDGDVCLLDDAHGVPLGVGRPGTTRERATTGFPPGSLLLLYSDGLVERRREPIDVALERLVCTVAGAWQLPLELLCDHLLGELTTNDRRDDIALLLLRSPVASGPVFLRKLPATVASLSGLRRELEGWLAQHEPDPAAVALVQHAVGEACMNVIDHAYDDPSQRYRVEAAEIDAEIVVAVTDTGTWRAGDPDPVRGRGLPIMHGLMDSVEVQRRPTGTSVVMRHRLAR